MQTFFTVVGVLTIVAAVTGAVIPGLSFHAYWGTDQGAKEWHIDHANRKDKP